MKKFILKPLQGNLAIERWNYFSAFIITVVLMLGVQKQADAARYMWNGGSSAAWTTNTNWIPSTGYPGSVGTTDTAFFANGTYSISAVPTKTIALLQISNTGGNANVTLTPTANATLTAKNFIVSSGCSVTLAANLIVAVSGTSTFSNSGTISGPGTLQFRSTATFPSGIGTGGTFGTTLPSVTLNAANQTVTLDASTAVADLTINNNNALVLSNYTVTVNGTFSNSARNNGDGLVGPGTIVFNATNSFPDGAGNNGVFSTNSTVYPNVVIPNGIAVTNTTSTSIGTLTLNSSSSSLTINNGSTLTLTGTLSNNGTIQGQATPTGTIQFNVATSFPQGLGTGGTFSSALPLRVTVNGAVTVAADANVTISTLTINNAAGILNDGGKTITVLGAVANKGAHNSATGGSITLTGSSAIRTLSGGGSYGNLTLNDGKGANVSANTTVNGALTLSNGIISPASADTLFVSSTGSTSSSGTSWVNGFLAEYFTSGSSISKTFPVGDNTVGYRPVTVTFASISNPGYLIVSNTPGAFTLVFLPPSIAQDVAAYWTIINHSIGYSTANVSFTYLPGDISGTQNKFVAENYVIDNQNNNYGNWLSGWTSTNPTATSTVASGVTTFGDFIIGDTIGIPVQITPAGALTFCQGGSVVLHSSVFVAGNYTYNWFSNSTALSNHGVTDTATTSGLYYLQIKNTGNNNLYYSDSILVTVNPSPTVNAGSAFGSAVCPGAPTIALGGSFGGGATAAVWSDGSAGGTFANNGGLTPGTTTYTPSIYASSTVTLTLTTSGGSCGTTNASKTITFKSSPVIPGLSYSSPARICGGSPVLISDTSTQAYSFQWLFNGVPIQGATSKQYSADTAGVYNISVTDPISGCSIKSPTVAVDRMPYIVPDTIFIPCSANSGDTTISLTKPELFSYSTSPAACNVDMSNANLITSVISSLGGGAESLIICKGGFLTDSFTGSNTIVVEPGGTFTGFGGGGSNTVYVKSGGTYIYNGNGTPGGNTIYYEPGATVSSNTGSYTKIMCNSIGVTYPANIALCDPFTYLWSTGDTTSSISVNPSQTTTYYVTVSEGNYYCTDSVVVSKVQQLRVEIAASDTDVCTGTPVSFNAIVTNGGSNPAYQWKANGSNVGTDSSAFSTGPLTNNDTIVCIVTSNLSCVTGSPATSNTIKVVVEPLPAPVLTVGGNATICSGDSIQVCAPDNFAAYLWNDGNTAFCTKALSAGDYWVSVTATNGCSAVSTHQSINTYPVPAVSIETQGDTLSSFGGVGYQWFFNGNKISGATDSFYVAQQSGTYSVQVTDSYNCLDMSTPVTVTGISNLLSDVVFEVYPNPAVTEIQIKIGGEWVGKEYALYDVCGKVVTTGITKNEVSIIDISAIARGVYFVKMNEYVRKFMKL